MSIPPLVLMERLNAKIKRMTRKRRRVYDREGRSRKWKSMKAASNELCRKRCWLFVDRQKENLTAADASRAFFRNVKAFDSKEKPTVFDVRYHFPGMEDLPVAESFADHFNASFVMPLTHLYNCITLSQNWPKGWKTEFVTPIPKSTAPSQLEIFKIFLAPYSFRKCMNALY